MSMTDDEIIRAFYTAFQRKDFASMQSLYHDEARFSDPVFRDLDSGEVKAMWEMLLKASSDLRITFGEISSANGRGGCRWEAWYTFSRTKRFVHNMIEAEFEFRDGKIFRHQDRFDFWRWSRQALGMAGWLLGWSPLVQNKVRKTARRSLDKFMQSK